MSADYSNIQQQPQIRKGLAITSLVLGIISIPTLGLFGVGAITAIALGAVAIGKIKKEPAIFGGKGMAIAGIITSAVSLLLIPVFAILASIAIPLMIEKNHTHVYREAAAVQTLRTIHNSQVTFQATKQRFGSLKDLTEGGFLEATYVTDPMHGYVYTSVAEVSPDKYCIQATRQGSSLASRDYNVDQDGVIRYIESETPRPVPCGEGVPIGGAGTGTNAR